MKIKRVLVYDQEKELIYKGSLLGLNYQKEHIILTCIELFDDDSPCIIHESYAIQTLADEVEKILLSLSEKVFFIDESLITKLSMLDKKYLGCQFELEVKK